MEAVGARPLVFLTRRRVMTAACVGVSCAITALMSLLCNGRLRGDMMLTGFVAALFCDHVVRRVTRTYRRQLAEAHSLLEERVRTRTRDLEEANRALMISDRMATAGKLAAGVSHEIRTPLQVITFAVEELEEEPDAAPELAGQRIALIRDAAARITTVARDLSSLARPIDDPLGAVGLAGVIASASRLASYQRGHNVTVECPSEAPEVIGNESRLVQVVLNLLINAMRATRDDAPNHIRVSAERRGDRVELAIRDTGTGMSEETRAKIFEPFFTTGSARGGTGLGLTICRRLVERMGGSIAVASTLGEGTTITVELRGT